jgi:hypothetical protein
MKPMLKASGLTRLKLKHGGLISSFALNFNLRHYTPARSGAGAGQSSSESEQGSSGGSTGGARMRRDEVGLCRLTW